MWRLAHSTLTSILTDIAFIRLVKYKFVSLPSAGKQTYVPCLLEKRYIQRFAVEHQTVQQSQMNYECYRSSNTIFKLQIV